VQQHDRIADNLEKELLSHLTELERALLLQSLEKVASRRRV
jgi:hypothetical protein